MTYNTIMDKILVDLKVLSKINQNGKLSTSSNSIHIENDKIYTPIMRYIYGDSRLKTVEKIQELISNSQQVSVSILQHSCMNIYQRNNEPASIEIVEFNKNYQQLKLLSNELSEKLGSPIVIKHKANGSGKLIVKYFNNDQLEGIIQKMS